MIRVSDFKSVIQVLDHFKDEETCKQYLEQRRWGGTVCCPTCGQTKIYRTNRGFRCADRDCAKKFSVTVGTIMENSKLKLRLWFAAMYLISAHKKGISSHQLARDLGIKQKAAWFMLHRIRSVMKEPVTEKLGLTNPVQIDEVWIGGKEKFKHKSTREKRGYAPGDRINDKTPVLGMIERDGKVKTIKVGDNKAETLQPIIFANVEHGSSVMTDEGTSYNGLSRTYTHSTVNHSEGVYVDGVVTTNAMENYWSLFKRSIIGIYHHVSPKHLDRYCEEMSYRFNSRKKTDCERLDYVFTHVNGRLTWKDLVNA